MGLDGREAKFYVYISKHNNGKARSREDHGASPSLWKEYYRKTRQTIQVQVGSGNLHVGKLNQMPQEKNISK